MSSSINRYTSARQTMDNAGHRDAGDIVRFESEIAELRRQDGLDTQLSEVEARIRPFTAQLKGFKLEKEKIETYTSQPSKLLAKCPKNLTEMRRINNGSAKDVPASVCSYVGSMNDCGRCF